MKTLALVGSPEEKVIRIYWLIRSWKGAEWRGLKPRNSTYHRFSQGACDITLFLKPTGQIVLKWGLCELTGRIVLYDMTRIILSAEVKTISPPQDRFQTFRHFIKKPLNGLYMSHSQQDGLFLLFV